MSRARYPACVHFPCNVKGNEFDLETEARATCHLKKFAEIASSTTLSTEQLANFCASNVLPGNSIKSSVRRSSVRKPYARFHEPTMPDCVRKRFVLKQEYSINLANRNETEGRQTLSSSTGTFYVILISYGKWKPLKYRSCHLKNFFA